MISDEVFITELEVGLKKLKILKKERTKKINEYLLLDASRRDSILDGVELSVRTFHQGKKEKNKIPLEDPEQVEVVRWWRLEHQFHVIMMLRNDGYRTAAEKARQHLLGLHKGASDLYIPYLKLWVEMKRCKNAKGKSPSVVHDDQYKFRDYVLSIGDNHIFGWGAEDAKAKITEFMAKKSQS